MNQRDEQRWQSHRERLAQHLADGGGCCASCSHEQIERAIAWIDEQSAAGAPAPRRMTLTADGVEFSNGD